MIPERIDTTTVELGAGMRVRRALPTRHRRLIGAWCFLDHFGPAEIARTRGMRIGPHPHIGLQTVTWLHAGELFHRDSLGSEQRIEPGALNLMTAGQGISHSEESPDPHSPQLHGVQFWVALPDAVRHIAPSFEHHPKVPSVTTHRLRISVLAGQFLGEKSPGAFHSPLMGASIMAPAGSVGTLPLREDWEYGAVVTYGRAEIAGQRVIPGSLIYLGPGRSGVPIVTGAGDAGVILVGGAPLGEDILMWWNFVARTKAEITKACGEWNTSAPRFGEVRGYDGERLTAPLPPWSNSDTQEVVVYP